MMETNTAVELSFALSVSSNHVKPPCTNNMNTSWLPTMVAAGIHLEDGFVSAPDKPEHRPVRNLPQPPFVRVRSST